MKYAYPFLIILFYCWLMLNGCFNFIQNALILNLIIAIILFVMAMILFILNFLKKLTMTTLQTVVDFNVLTLGQQSQDTQLGVIEQVRVELEASVQPALDLVLSTQAQLVLDQAAIDAAQVVLDAAKAKLATDQVDADAAITVYNLVSVDLNAWTAAQTDIVDDAATVVTLQDIYLRNGGI
jgi:hypothetical protein